ncbi:MAG TPA: DNA mismatch endonuclease Vsr [Phycisphaerae bacterium]|jgi:DNA mismatch endonuclease (patch repair protein)
MIIPHSRDAALRSRIMASVRQKGTEPEIAVRRCLRRLGHRFRCNRRGLPGSPDLVIPSESLVLFVHGCFWHRHRCRYGTTPKANQEFWLAKFADNQTRDRRIKRDLRKAGWRVAIVWECWTRDSAALESRLQDLLNRQGNAR